VAAVVRLCSSMSMAWGLGSGVKCDGMGWVSRVMVLRAVRGCWKCGLVCWWFQVGCSFETTLAGDGGASDDLEPANWAAAPEPPLAAPATQASPFTVCALCVHGAAAASDLASTLMPQMKTVAHAPVLGCRIDPHLKLAGAAQVVPHGL
jgi:hypothetical protein